MILGRKLAREQVERVADWQQDAAVPLVIGHTAIVGLNQLFA